MSKEEYISSLKVALQGFEEDLVQEIVTDYEERFAVGVEKGKTEEQIIAELGSIEELVMELKELQSLNTSSVADWNIGEKKVSTKEIKETEQNVEEQQEQQEQKEKTEQNKNNWKENASFYDSFEILMRNVGKVVENVVKKAEEAVEQVEAYMEETKRKHFYEETGTSFEGAEKESDGTHNVEQSGEADETCRKVIIDAGIADVKIQRTNESVVKGVCHYYSYKTAMSYPFYTKQQGDIFYLGIHKVEDTKSGFFQFQLAPAVKIEVFIPETIQEIEVLTSSGDVELQEVVLGDLKLRSSSGDIKIAQFTVETCSVETMSGDVTIRDSKAKKAEIAVKSGDCEFFNVQMDTLSASSKSGDLAIDGLRTQTATLSTMSGDQATKHLQVEELKVATASGDIAVTDCECKKMLQSSASGDITINADCKEYYVQSKSGDISLISRYDANAYISTTSGDITLDMLETVGNYQVEMSSVSGECHVSGNEKKETAEDSYKMEVKSISGDVFVRFRG